jgi:hypothetical protein
MGAQHLSVRLAHAHLVVRWPASAWNREAGVRSHPDIQRRAKQNAWFPLAQQGF